MSDRRAYICARVRLEEDGTLSIDRKTVTVESEDYFATARLITDQPGSMVAVWWVDSLLIPTWPKEGPLGVEEALRWVGGMVPLLLLLRAEWDGFFQIGKGYEESVRLPEEGASAESS